MRSTLFLTVFSILFLTACRDDEASEPRNRVTIEDTHYATAIIGTLTWMTENYAGPGGLLYDGNNSKPEYGKYYTMEEVDAITLPEGWRLPTEEDYRALAEHVGITSIASPLTDTDKVKSLTSKEYWKHTPGSNSSGFNAYPAGYIFADSAPMDGDIAEFWVAGGLTLSIQEAGMNANSLRMVFYQSDTSPNYRFNVRFVKE